MVNVKIIILIYVYLINVIIFNQCDAHQARQLLDTIPEISMPQRIGNTRSRVPLNRTNPLENNFRLALQKINF